MAPDRPILITGAARSGTSMTAGLIHLHGAFGGVMSGPTANNRKGMFENAHIRNVIVKPILNSWGADPMCQEPLPDIRQVEQAKEELAPYLRRAVQETMVHEGYRGGPWFYKGAKMCLMWPLWDAAFPNAKWVIVRRPKEQIVQSCLKTGFMRKRHSAESWGEWVDIHLRRFQEMEANLDTAEVHTSDIIHGNLDGLKRVITHHLEMEFHPRIVEEFVDTKLWHHKKET